jgi:hypothetical protein
VTNEIKLHPIWVAHEAELERIKLEHLSKVDLIEAGSTIEITFTRNGYNAYGGKCTSDGTYNGCVVRVICNGFKVVGAGGPYPYIMPEINGKCVKTKNKTFTVTATEVGNPYIDRDGKVTQLISINGGLYDYDDYENS